MAYLYHVEGYQIADDLVEKLKICSQQQLSRGGPYRSMEASEVNVLYCELVLNI